MSNYLMPSLPERRVWPFAVSLQRTGDDEPLFFHYARPRPAQDLIYLMCGTDDPSSAPEDMTIRLFVANMDSHVRFSSAVGVGWFEVGTFDKNLCREVRDALAYVAQRDALMGR